MAKVIISFLGTGGYQDRNNKSRGSYRKTMYSIDNKVYECEFVTDALMQHYSAERIIYIGTLKSMWEVVFDTFVSEPDANKWQQLAELVDEANFQTSIDNQQLITDNFKNTIITPIILKYGLNDEENEFNIGRLFEIEQYLNNGDKLYLDVSHGFRSLPIVLTSVLNFIIENSSKELTLEHISYGMFEVSHEMDNISPIVNLNVVMDMNKTLKAAHEFKEYGNGYLFAELLENTDKSISSILESFSESKSLNHIYELKNKIQQLKNLKYDKLSVIQKKTVPETIKDFIKRFNKAKTDSHYQYEIAKWMFDKKQYGFAAISLTESILTKACELKGLDLNKEYHRKLVKKNLILIDTNIDTIWKNTNKIRKSSAHSLSVNKNTNRMICILKESIEASKSFIYSSYLPNRI